MGQPFDLAGFVTKARRVGVDSQRVEVKEAAGGLPKSIVDTISAFANGSGGVIVCGLSERQGFTPVEGFDPRRVSNALAQACSDRVEPRIYGRVDVEDFEGALVVVARIPELPPYLKPCYVKARSLYDGAFIRIGDGDHRLSRYEVDRLLEERHQPCHDEAIVERATLGDLDKDLVEAFVERVRDTSSRMVKELPFEDVLRIKGAAALDAEGVLRPTLAGVMALGSYPQQFYPRAKVSFLVVPGLSKADLSPEGDRYVDSRFIEGPIPYLIDETLYHVRRNMRISSKVEGAFRTDTADYPEAALREALANALMHRDYSPEGLGSPVQVNMYDDRIEVMNPGGLYGSVTVETIGTLGGTAARNQVLASILEATPYDPKGKKSEFDASHYKPDYVVENKGTGFYQMRVILGQEGMAPPVVHDYVSTLQLLIYKGRFPAGDACEGASLVDLAVGPSAEGGGRRSQALADAGPSSVEYAVVQLLEAEEPVRAERIVEHTGKSKATVNRLLNKLIGQGVVERIGGTRGPGVAYQLAERAPAPTPA